MAILATIVAVAALIGAVVSWIVGAVFFVRTLRVLSASATAGRCGMRRWPGRSPRGR